MSTFNLTVHGMTCTGCTTRLKRVLAAMEGVVAIDIVLETGQVTVDRDGIEAEAIKTAIIDAGFVVI